MFGIVTMIVFSSILSGLFLGFFVGFKVKTYERRSANFPNGTAFGDWVRALRFRYYAKFWGWGGVIVGILGVFAAAFIPVLIFFPRSLIPFEWIRYAFMLWFLLMCIVVELTNLL